MSLSELCSFPSVGKMWAKLEWQDHERKFLFSSLTSLEIPPREIYLIMSRANSRSTLGLASSNSRWKYLACCSDESSFFGKWNGKSSGEWMMKKLSGKTDDFMNTFDGWFTTTVDNDVCDERSWRHWDDFYMLGWLRNVDTIIVHTYSYIEQRKLKIQEHFYGLWMKSSSLKKTTTFKFRLSLKNLSL